ncbi:MAG: enoyl-CoA hydratase/isomerase family protein, partial [Desulfobacterales bacterium]
SYSEQNFADFLNQFTRLYTYMFLYPKPIVAALNGHAIAGGCMLALACDYRVMVSGRAKISLNEISFGSSVFAGSTEMLRFCVGNRNATEVLYSGAMYTAEEAKVLGLIDAITAEEDLIHEATKKAMDLGEKPGPAFTSIKLLLRKSVAEAMRLKEKDAINDFVEIWYSDTTQENLKNIKIY